MTKRWIGFVPCASIVCLIALSCGNSDGDGAGAGGKAGASGSSSGGTAGTSSGGGNAGADDGDRAGAAGDQTPAAGTSATAGASVGGDAGATTGGGGGDGGGAGAPEDTSPLSPAAISDLAFWMDGNAPSYSDLDENKLTPVDSGRVRSIPEAPPLTGSWRAPTSAERPIRELGALNLKPIETSTGYYLADTAGSIQTDDSTLAISFRPLLGAGNGAAGGISGPIGASAQTLGLTFVGNGIGLQFNHTSFSLKRRLSRGAHVTIIVRFTATGVDIQYDIDGLRAAESITATSAHEMASKFTLGYANGAGMYGYVSQVVGVNRAVSDAESSRLMTWLTAQPMPAAFPVSKPLVAILGDSIANGDQVAAWQSWPFRMLADLSDTNPEVQLLNAAINGGGIPKVKNSDYSEVVLPSYSADRAKNILIVAAGTNDLANGNNLSDMLDRYYSLLDSARATGWWTVASTILPRSNPGMVVGVAGFETVRSAFNADVVANWASHADALADVAAVKNIGAAGDSDNTTYYSDKVHPNPAGHALLESVYLAAIKSQL